MTGPRRNDPHHSPAFNGDGHRRKLVNQRVALDRYEARARKVITDVFAELEDVLKADADRRARREVALLEGWVAGDPGE